jgi:probable HAF family extracellular repeat protein
VVDNSLSCLPVGTLRTVSIPIYVASQLFDNGSGLGNLTVASKHPFSTDGSTIVGFKRDYNGQGDTQAFVWTTQSGLSWLYDLPGGRDSAGAYVTNANGTILGGNCWSSTVGGQGCTWDATHNATSLGAGIYGMYSTYVYGMSSDGQILAGGAYGQTIGRVFAFRKTPSGFTDLGSLVPNGEAVAADVSSDGSIVVGYAATSGTSSEPFMWTQGAGMVSLGMLTAGTNNYGTANAISADGSTVVGWTDYQYNCGGQCSWRTDPRAFRWTQATGIQALPQITQWTIGPTWAHAVSADGSIVLGSRNGNMGTDYWVWSAAHGSELIEDVFARLGIHTGLINPKPIAVLKLGSTVYLTGTISDGVGNQYVWRTAYQ